MGKAGIEPAMFTARVADLQSAAFASYAYLPKFVYVMFRKYLMRGGNSRSVKSETRDRARLLDAGVIEENRTLIFRATI